jgi:hypothetical protein
MGPRIRTIKPEIWHSADFLRLSWLGRLAFVTLITQADDEGRLKTDALTLSTFLVPAVAGEVEAQLQVMEDRGMVRRYGGRNRQLYISLCNWPAHQRIDHPTKSKIPPPPISKPRRVLGESSRRIRSDRNGSDQTGTGSISTTSHSAIGGDLLVLQAEVSVSPFDQVWQAWLGSRALFAIEQGRRVGHVRLDEARRRRINNALKTYPLEDVLDAVEGWRFSPHHCGENDRGTVYNDLDLLLRDAKHIEEFRDYKRRGHVVTLPGKRTLAQSYREQAAALKEAGD